MAVLGDAGGYWVQIRMRLLPDPSPGPFDLKTEIHLQMMGLDYRKLCKGRANAPKAKLPYIVVRSDCANARESGLRLWCMQWVARV